MKTLPYRFELVSVAENYGDYLAALEIPAYLIYFIQSSAESMIFEVLGDSWRWEIDKGQSRGLAFYLEHPISTHIRSLMPSFVGALRNQVSVRYTRFSCSRVGRGYHGRTPDKSTLQECIEYTD